MKILIIEPECNGHHIITYIRFILRLLLSNKIEVILLTSLKSKNHFSLKAIKKIYPKIKIKFIKYSKPKNFSSFFLLLHQIKLYFSIKKTFTEITANYRINKVFINSIDHFDKALSIFGDPFKKTPFVGMYTLPKFHFPSFKFDNSGRFELISKYLFKRLLNIDNLFKILVNDHFFLKYLKKSRFKNAKKVNFFYHPVEPFKKYSKKISYKKLGLPKNVIPILVYGYLKISKGIVQLLQAIGDQRVYKRAVVILAGDQDVEIRKILQKKFYNNLVKNKKLFIYEGFQNDKQESILLSAAKIVWVGYRNILFTSGILHQAAVKRIPVIATSQGVIGNLTLKYNLGLRVNVDSKNSIIKSINEICYKKYNNKILSKQNKFVKNSNPKLFMKLMYDLLVK
jgi:hypothetical protein